MQLYRGMDVGTAKLTEAERRGVPHHLLDVWDVRDPANVADYQRMARAAFQDIAGRGRVPVLVGGSGLYVRAALDDLAFPGTDDAVRARLEAELADAGPAALHARLAALDPQAAAAILPSNGRRVVRALEVVELTGEPFTASLPEPSYAVPAVQVGLAVDRDLLDGRIEARVDRMWEQGLVAEVRSLAERGLREGRTAGRALGYAQVLRFLAGEWSEEEARQATVRPRPGGSPAARSRGSAATRASGGSTRTGGRRSPVRCPSWRGSGRNDLFLVGMPHDCTPHPVPARRADHRHGGRRPAHRWAGAGRGPRHREDPDRGGPRRGGVDGRPGGDPGRPAGAAPRRQRGGRGRRGRRHARRDRALLVRHRRRRVPRLLRRPHREGAHHRRPRDGADGDDRRHLPRHPVRRGGDQRTLGRRAGNAADLAEGAAQVGHALARAGAAPGPAGRHQRLRRGPDVPGPDREQRGPVPRHRADPRAVPARRRAAGGGVGLPQPGPRPHLRAARPQGRRLALRGAARAPRGQHGPAPAGRPGSHPHGAAGADDPRRPRPLHRASCAHPRRCATGVCASSAWHRRPAAGRPSARR